VWAYDGSTFRGKEKRPWKSCISRKSFR
jgi:hypothetical protein